MPPVVHSGSSSLPVAAPGSLQVRFGCEEAAVSVGSAGIDVALPLPLLAGRATEAVLAGREGRVAVAEWDGVPVLMTGDDRVAGAVAVPVDGDADGGGLEEVVFETYRRILRAAAGEWRLYRFWNHVPRINEVRHGLENYRAFNLGRWRAFAEAGEGNAADRGWLPAASAVGHGPSVLVVVFVGGRQPASWLENPVQVPAYRYPELYGPRPPCFSRALRVGDAGPIYLSGTASIRGHRSVGRGDLRRQLATTADNVERMLQALGCGPADGWKCYLRAATDLEEARSFFAGRFGDEFVRGGSFLVADICRSELLVEVEATFASGVNADAPAPESGRRRERSPIPHEGRAIGR